MWIRRLDLNPGRLQPTLGSWHPLPEADRSCKINIMLSLDIGLDGILASAVPEAYAAYRRPLIAALAFFMDNLSPGRAAAIVRDQLTLPPDAADADRLFALAQHSPTLHKLGQILARNRQLDPQLRRTLQRLESMPSALSSTALGP